MSIDAETIQNIVSNYMGVLFLQHLLPSLFILGIMTKFLRRTFNI